MRSAALGLGDTSDRNKFEMVGCGNEHTMAIDEDGKLWGCGFDVVGELGYEGFVGTEKMAKIQDDKKFRFVTCKGYNTMVISEDESCGMW